MENINSNITPAKRTLSIESFEKLLPKSKGREKINSNTSGDQKRHIPLEDTNHPEVPDKDTADALEPNDFDCDTPEGMFIPESNPMEVETSEPPLLNPPQVILTVQEKNDSVVSKEESSPPKELEKENSNQEEAKTTDGGWGKGSGSDSASGSNSGWDKASGSNKMDDEKEQVTAQDQPATQNSDVSTLEKFVVSPPTLVYDFSDDRIINELYKLDMENEKLHKCWYCDVRTLRDLVKCLDCEVAGRERYFCNTGRFISHIISHMKATKHQYIAYHRNGPKENVECHLTNSNQVLVKCRNIFDLWFNQNDQKFYCMDHLLSNKEILVQRSTTYMFSVVTASFLDTKVCNGGHLVDKNDVTHRRIELYERHRLQFPELHQDFASFNPIKPSPFEIENTFTSMEKFRDYWMNVLIKEQVEASWRYKTYNYLITPHIERTDEGTFFTFEDNRLQWTEFIINESLVIQFYNPHITRNAKFVEINNLTNKFKAKLLSKGAIPPGQMTENWFITFKAERENFKRMQKALELFAETEKKNEATLCHPTIIDVLKNPAIMNDLETLSRDNIRAPDHAFNRALSFRDWNIKQREAIENAQKYVISVCKGCPGSGKSDVAAAIINMFSDCDKFDKILVCAASNEAVEVILEKAIGFGLQKWQAVRLNSMTFAYKNENISPFSLERLEKELPKANPQLYAQLKEQYLQLHREEFEIPREERKKAREEARNAKLIAQGKTPKSKEKMEEDEMDDVEEIDNPEMDQKFQTIVRHSILKRAKVIFTTNHMSCHWMLNLSKYPFNFNMVVMDECSQIKEPETLLALKKGCKKLVLYGDKVQIPPTTFSFEVRNALEQTLLDRLCRNNSDSITWLKEQYRLDSSMTEFLRHMGYKKFMYPRNPAVASIAHKIFSWWPQNGESFVWLDLKGAPEKSAVDNTSLVNAQEKLIVVKLVNQIIKRHHDKYKVAVITPYNGQVESLKLSLSNHPNVSVHSIDSFQGKETDIVIISFVRSNYQKKIGFLQDSRRMNVVLSRAKRALVMIGDYVMFSTFGAHKRDKKGEEATESGELSEADEDFKEPYWPKLTKYVKTKRAYMSYSEKNEKIFPTK